MVLSAVASVARNACQRIAANPCAQGPARAPPLSWQSAYNDIKSHQASKKCLPSSSSQKMEQCRLRYMFCMIKIASDAVMQ